MLVTWVTRQVKFEKLRPLQQRPLNLMTCVFLKAPTYHWGGWDGHIGGVNCLHLDTFGLVASNACRHQITTRCIEREDESKKDNLLIYDFWQPGIDARRPQAN